MGCNYEQISENASTSDMYIQYIVNMHMYYK